MLKEIKYAVALTTILAMGACNSVTGPQGEAQDQGSRGKNKDQPKEFVNAPDQIAPNPGDGGGGSGPGERDGDSERPGRKRTPDELTPDE
jgi:hypothetical protein